MRARLVSLAAVVATATMVPALMLVGAQPAAAGGAGNKGSLKVSEVGGAADESNDPHVGCTFDLQWYGFQRSDATVSFASQAPTKTAVITKTAGPDTVSLGAAASGSVLNTTRTYTLKFTGADPQANQGYHVKVTTKASGANGAESKYKVFWVTCDRADAPPVTPPVDNPPVDNPPVDNPPVDNPPADNPGSFDWNWTYDDPTCDGVTVDYPSDIPEGQANDVNVRVETDHGTQTLNFHNNEGTWSGLQDFNLVDHPQWDAGTKAYAITWVQVGGTNYHWQGDVSCTTDGDPSTTDAPKLATDVTSFRTGTVTVNQGSAVAADSVVVKGAGEQDLQLERWISDSARGAGATGHWATIRTIPTAADGSARVTFPRLTQKGVYQFRLAVAGSEVATGDTTGTLTVRVR